MKTRTCQYEAVIQFVFTIGEFLLPNCLISELLILLHITEQPRDRLSSYKFYVDSFANMCACVLVHTARASIEPHGLKKCIRHVHKL